MLVLGTTFFNQLLDFMLFSCKCTPFTNYIWFNINIVVVKRSHSHVTFCITRFDSISSLVVYTLTLDKFTFGTTFIWVRVHRVEKKPFLYNECYVLIAFKSV